MFVQTLWAEHLQWDEGRKQHTARVFTPFLGMNPDSCIVTYLLPSHASLLCEDTLFLDWNYVLLCLAVSF